MRYLKLFLCLVICVGGGWLSGLFTEHGLKYWYPHLVKSSLTPPSLAFPITWTILYILMGISLYLIWTTPKKNKKLAITFFVVQLFFNFIWSFIFFYAQKTGIALVDIVCLWIAILATMVLFYRISKPATYILIPYLAWVSFAFYLNLFIWMHN
jgi:translocator protein